MLVYVAGPYSAPTREGVAANIAKAEAIGKAIIQAGYVPVIPHRITGHWETDPTFDHWTHDDWMQRFCLPLLDRCDAILMMPGWEHSKGSRMEYEYAGKAGKAFLFDVHLPRGQNV